MLRIIKELNVLSFSRISDFFAVVLVCVVQKVLHERGFSKLKASRAKKYVC